MRKVTNNARKPLFDALTMADSWGPHATSLSFESFLYSKANPPERLCKVLQFPFETYNEDFVAFSQLHTLSLNIFYLSC